MTNRETCPGVMRWRAVGTPEEIPCELVAGHTGRHRASWVDWDLGRHWVEWSDLDAWRAAIAE